MSDASLADSEKIPLQWRSVLADDDSPYTYADWVRDLSDRSGVYLIRADPRRFENELLYIGESHTRVRQGRKRTYRGLYRTLTRHFNTADWSQGLTYDPADILVAVVLTAAELALDYQDVLIARYNPRDNELSNQIRAAQFGV